MIGLRLSNYRAEFIFKSSNAFTVQEILGGALADQPGCEVSKKPRLGRVKSGDAFLKLNFLIIKVILSFVLNINRTVDGSKKHFPFQYQPAFKYKQNYTWKMKMPKSIEKQNHK